MENMTRKQIFEAIAKFDIEKGIGLLLNMTGEQHIKSVRETYADLETPELLEKLHDRLQS